MRIFGTTGHMYQIGDVVTRAKDASTGDYEQIPIGRIVREATEAEWFEAQPICKQESERYPNARSLFTFEHYYQIEPIDV
jgi:hypothetical protein